MFVLFFIVVASFEIDNNCDFEWISFQRYGSPFQPILIIKVLPMNGMCLCVCVYVRLNAARASG
jgi:hypothetical protein